MRRCPRTCTPAPPPESTSAAGGTPSAVSLKAGRAPNCWGTAPHIRAPRPPPPPPAPVRATNPPLCSLTGTFGECPKGTVYAYNMSSCGRSCRSLSQVDYSCRARFAAVDGCGCADGTYMNEEGQCVSSSSCPCYAEDAIIPSGQAVSRDGSTW